MSRQSNQPRKPRKADIDRPVKPYDGFPLGPANNGYWQKKINGKIHYFAHWGRIESGKMVRLPGDGWKAALDLYEQQRDDLFAGRTPRKPGDERLTLKTLCNRFLTAKKHQIEAGEITRNTFDEYKGATDRLIAQFGKDRSVDGLASDDFEALRANLAKRYGPVRLANEIQETKAVFKYGYESGLITNPMRYGPQFKKPSKSVIRKHRATNGQRMLEAAELWKCIYAADAQLKAMLLLGINCGMGNHDVAMLPFDALDLDGGWLRFPRPKTGIDRR